LGVVICYFNQLRVRIFMDYLGMAEKSFLVMGVANKKSVAYEVGRQIESLGGKVLYVVRNNSRRESVSKLLQGKPIYVCDVENQTEIDSLAVQLAADNIRLSGLVHSIAYADYSEGIKPFHETERASFLQAVDISAFSLIAISRAVKPLLLYNSSVVTIGISTTRMASESYGYMAPVKAALDSSLSFLAKSFSKDSEVRFNSVGAGLLKTSSSAGIPGYVDAYLFAEKVIPRRRAVKTEEVASTVVFLLSPRSSGITAQSIIVDAGMSVNYFDRQLISETLRP